MANSTDRQTPELAPPWLPRQQRRWVDRELRKLHRRGVCSLCGGAFRHGGPTAPGFDTQGNVALACEGCIGCLAEVFGLGLYLPRERSAEAFAAHIADTDQLLAGVERRGGDIRASEVNVQDYAWKRDDARWFEQNPSRSHRARAPFPGEIEDAELPTGCVPIMLIRQIEPSCRMRVACDLSVDLLPLPDDEAAVHALFDTAMRREAVTVQTVRALIEEYRTKGAH